MGMEPSRGPREPQSVEEAQERLDDFRKRLEWKNKLTAEQHDAVVSDLKRRAKAGIMRSLEDSPSRRARERLDARIAAASLTPGPCPNCGADDWRAYPALAEFGCWSCGVRLTFVEVAARSREAARPKSEELERLLAEIIAARQLSPGSCPQCGSNVWKTDPAAGRFECATCVRYVSFEDVARAEAKRMRDLGAQESQGEECDCGGPPGHVPGGIQCRRA